MPCEFILICNHDTVLSCLFQAQRPAFLLQWRCSPSQYDGANHSTQGWRSDITGPRAAASTSPLASHSLLSTPSHTRPSLGYTAYFSHLLLIWNVFWRNDGLRFCPGLCLPSPTCTDVLHSGPTQMSLLFEIIRNAWLTSTIPLLINLSEKEVSRLQWNWQRLATNLLAFTVKII